MKMRMYRFHFDFMGLQKICIPLSLILVLGSWLLFVTKGPRYGVDFSGGTEMLVAFASEVDADAVRGTLAKGGFSAPDVQSFEGSHRQYLIRLAETSDEVSGMEEKVTRAFGDHMPGSFASIEKNESIGAVVGEEYRQRGAMAILYSLIGLLIYVAFRFANIQSKAKSAKVQAESWSTLGRRLLLWSRWGWGGILSLFHDVSLTIGLFVLLGKEFNLPIVAALLTIVGYSINDTIVIFDRIRENMQIHAGKKLEWLMNLAINDTLSRTLLTSLTVWFVAAALYLIGGGIIHDFALALLIGTLSGSYSTIYIASPVVAWIEKRFGGLQAA